MLFQDPGGRPTAAKNAGAYAELALKLAAAFRSDRRFHNVTWWSLEEGPPEPNEIGPAALNRQAREDAAHPVSASGKEGGRPAWGCLTLALLVTLNGAAFLIFLLVAGMRDGEMIFGAVWNLGLGLIGLLWAWRRRVET